MHEKYSGGNSASFLPSKLFLRNMIFPEPLNLVLGTSDDSKWHPNGPRTILGKSVFWPSSTFLVTTFYLLLVQEEDLLVQEEDLAREEDLLLVQEEDHICPYWCLLVLIGAYYCLLGLITAYWGLFGLLIGAYLVCIWVLIAAYKLWKNICDAKRTSHDWQYNHFVPI